MTTAADIVHGTINGQIWLSKQGGRGVHYHEAFHYVNLLLHNSAVRSAIYKEYLRQHPKLNTKGLKLKDVEEMLADDFRKYVEMMEADNISNKLKRIYNRFLDFIHTSRKKDALRMLYEDIRNGKYSKNAKLDPQSLKEFREAWKNIAPSAFTSPLTRDSNIDNFKSITDYHTFYRVAEGLAHGLLKSFAVNSAEDIAKVHDEGLFNAYIEQLKLQQDVMYSDVI